MTMPQKGKVLEFSYVSISDAYMQITLSSAFGGQGIPLTLATAQKSIIESEPSGVPEEQ